MFMLCLRSLSALALRPMFGVCFQLYKFTLCVCVCAMFHSKLFSGCVCVCVCFDCEFAEYLSNCEHEQTITLPRNEASEILNSKIAKMSVLSIWRYLSAFPSLLCLFSFVVVSRIQVTFPPRCKLCVCVSSKEYKRKQV